MSSLLPSEKSVTEENVRAVEEKNVGIIEHASTSRISKAKLVLFSLGAFATIFITAFQAIAPASFFVQAVEPWGVGVSSLWMLASYLICYISFILPGVRIAEQIGHLTVFWIGIVVFVIFAGVSGHASSARTFDVLRAFQGLGGSLMSSVATHVVYTHISTRSRPLLNYALCTAQIFGLGVSHAIGGKLAVDNHFRWAIWVSAPLVALPAILCTPALIDLKKASRTDAVTKSIARFDFIGTILLIGTVCMLTIGLVFGGNEHKWSTAIVICLIVFGSVSICIFIAYEEFFAKEPILNTHWLLQRNTAISIASTLLSSMTFFAASVYVPIMLLTVRQLETDEAGRGFSPFWGTALAGGIVAGFVLRAKPALARPFVWVGFLLATIFSGLYYTFTVDGEKSKDQAFMAISGLGIALAFPGVSYYAQISVPSEESGLIGTTMHFVSIVGGMLGLILYQACLKSRLIVNLDAIFASNDFLSVMDIRTMDIAGLETSAPIMISHVGEDVAAEIADQMIASLHTTFIISVPLLAVSFIVTLLYKSVRVEN